MAASASSLTALVLPWAISHPDSIAVRTPPGDQRIDLSYARLLGEVAAARDRYADLGLAPGERVILIAPTCPEYLIEFLGADAAGLVVVAANPLATAREVAYLIADSGARHVVRHPGVSDAGAKAAGDAGISAHTLSVVAQAGPEIRPPADAATGDSPLGFFERGRTDLSALLYTSGTTGNPKGAMLSLGNLLAAVETVHSLVEPGAEENWATALPLFHIYGLSGVALPSLAAGRPLTLFPRWDPGQFLAALDHDQITVISGVPTMWMSLLADASKSAAPALRAVSSGGAAIAGEVVRSMERRFDAPVVEGYGLTETTALGSFNPLDGVRKVGSVGTPVPGGELKVIDESGAEAPANTVGEVCIRGAFVMLGYWNRPEATAEVLSPDGWFRTGDLGRIDEDGYLFIVDRLKDLILHGGYNVYPREVEEILYEIPGVREAAVIGTPDEKYGQQVTAVLTRADSDAGRALDAATVERVSRENLAAYKIPRIVEFIDEMPKGPSGKILKRALSDAREESSG